MKPSNKIRITYIGGGSRGWAWHLMSDLAVEKEIGGEVILYDINEEAAKANEIIGNKIPDSPFVYKTAHTLAEALRGTDFVVISILPGTFTEMRSDVHAPEAYGIWQPVGDSTGPGGIVRAMRTIPMYIEIAQAIEQYAPEAWVINYTNPMKLCMDTLYKTFPKIKAFGCCHEVFGTQALLGRMLKELEGIEDVKRHDIKVNVIGVNHFTWITDARYKDIDLFPLYSRFVDQYAETGTEIDSQRHGVPYFDNTNRVKFDLYQKSGRQAIAAAGDRHLAEFCPGYWYLKNPETVKEWGFALTPVDYREEDLHKKLQKSAALVSGETAFAIEESGEEGVLQIKAIMGLHDFVTNVNLPNLGQVSDLPLGEVVETNAWFTAGQVRPVMAGAMPALPHAMTVRVVDNYRCVLNSCFQKDLTGCLKAFIHDPLVCIAPEKAEALFTAMVNNTRKYLTWYDA